MQSRVGTIADVSERVKEIVDVYVLDQNFHKIDVIDDYTSLIWSRRYYETGDFEIYVNASVKNINLLKIGYFVMRLDDEEIFRIETVEITTNVEEGDFITASGRDLRSILYQRCTQFAWKYAPARYEMTIRTIVYQNFINTEDYESFPYEDGTTNPTQGLAYHNDIRRKVPHFTDGGDKGLEDYSLDIWEIPVSNIGELIEEQCDALRWGWRVVYQTENEDDRFISEDYELVFDVYKGDDKSNLVIFSEEYENLMESSYKDDRTEYYNSFVIADTESAQSIVFSTTSGLDRYEALGESADLNGNYTKTMTFQNIVNIFGWSNLDYDLAYVTGANVLGIWWKTKLHDVTLLIKQWDFPLYTDERYMNNLKTAYPSGEQIEKGGISYWRVKNLPLIYKVDIEDSGWWGNDGDTFPYNPNGYQWLPTYVITLPDLLYQSIMQSNAYAKIEIYQHETEFKGEIEPNTTYKYKEDYNIGDLVTVKTKFGLEKKVRISEVIETFDQDGYTIDVNFEAED